MHHLDHPGEPEPPSAPTPPHDEHSQHAAPAMPAPSMEGMDMRHAGHVTHEGHGGREDHAAHADHTGHEQMFRIRFWGSLLLSIPVLVFSPVVEHLLGFRLPAFPGSDWIPFVFALVVFAYGGVPFIKMAVTEIRNRQPGMMTLITMAISAALVYSVAAQRAAGLRRTE